MSFLSLISAVPPIALIVLFVVIGIILFELFILFKKKKSKNGQEPLVNTTPIEGFGATTAAPQTAAAKIPETPLPSKEGPSPQSPQLAQEKPPKKGFHLSRRTILLAGATLLILIAIPITVFLVKQQQEVRSRADTVNNCCQDPTYVNAPCDGGGDSALSEAQWNQGWYDCNNQACGACQGVSSVCGNGQCEPGESANTCPSDCEGSPQDPGPGDTGGGGGGDSTGGSDGTGQIGSICSDASDCMNSSMTCVYCRPEWNLVNSGKSVCSYDTTAGIQVACSTGSEIPPGGECIPGTVNCSLCGSGVEGDVYGQVCQADGRWSGTCVRADACGYVASEGSPCNDIGYTACSYGLGCSTNEVLQCNSDRKWECVEKPESCGTGPTNAFIGCGDVVAGGNGDACANCYSNNGDQVAEFCVDEGASCGAKPECQQQPPPPTQPPGPPTTQPPTTQPPQVSGSCQAIKVYTVSGNTWTKVGQADLPNLRPGQEIKIAVIGTASGSSGFDRARIRVNGGAWQSTTSKNPNGEYYINFVIPNDVINFTFEGEVHHTELNQWL